MGKIDPEAALSPLVLTAYCEYVRSHRLQGSKDARSDDNWQLGISPTSYMKSLWRHLLEAWRIHREIPAYKGENVAENMNDALCAIIFNAQGMLHERLKKKVTTFSAFREEKLSNAYFKGYKDGITSTSNQKPQSLEERRQQASPQDGLVSSPQPTIYPDDWPHGEL